MASSLHVENLFATPLIVDQPPEASVGRRALMAGAEHLLIAGRRATICDDMRALPAAASLIAHVRKLADRWTVDTRTGTPPKWQVYAAIHAGDGGAQPEPPPRYDAYWAALYVLDDGYDEDAAKSAGGEFVLLDPRLPAPMVEMPRLRTMLVQGASPSFYAPELTVRPVSGQLFLYPGYLRIQQRPRGGDRPRLLVEMSLVASLDHGDHGRT